VNDLPSLASGAGEVGIEHRTGSCGKRVRASVGVRTRKKAGGCPAVQTLARNSVVPRRSHDTGSWEAAFLFLAWIGTMNRNRARTRMRTNGLMRKIMTLFGEVAA
jgi:hypothetical protein